MSEKTIRVEFDGAHGAKLAARLEMPAQRPIAYVLFAHCFTCSKDVAAVSRISRGLRRRGFAVLRFDFTGLGNSEGDFGNTNFSSNIADVVAAADFLRAHHRAPAVMLGHSLGGTAVLVASARVPECRAVATIGSPFDPAHVKRLMSDATTVVIGERSFAMDPGFLPDLERQDVAATIGGMKRALLVLHAPLDEVVGYDHAARIFGAAKHPKSFVSLDGADHMLTRAEDAEFAASMLAAWAPRYLDARGAAASPSPKSAPRDVVTVAEADDGKFTAEIVVGAHRLIADEPTALGGNDRGPGPHDFLLAGLGACTTMTLRMYAERKQWPLRKSSVDLTRQKIEEDGEKVEHIERKLHLEGDLTKEQRDRLSEIADRCPVHKTLTGKIKIQTTQATA